MRHADNMSRKTLTVTDAPSTETSRTLAQHASVQLAHPLHTSLDTPVMHIPPDHPASARSRTTNPTWGTCRGIRHHPVPVRKGHRPGAPCTKAAVSTHANIEANHARHPHTIR
uniref:Uncharacterized protein n=1 Tax=mine drainage metagenome TaxID=410659 RepID=E6PK78_9ZZZZ